jgi:hypothetical protein
LRFDATGGEIHSPAGDGLGVLTRRAWAEAVEVADVYAKQIKSGKDRNSGDRCNELV